MMDAIVSIGRDNTSMKEVADRLGITYSHMMQTRSNMVRRNGYSTFLGFLCDYLREGSPYGSEP